MPLDSLCAAPANLDDFRVTAPREIASLLRHLCDSSTPLYLYSAHGEAVSATLWNMDAERASIGFGVEVDDPALPALLEGRQAVVVAYLDSVKLQFDAHHLLLVHGARNSVLNGTYPGELYRFQRRDTFRVRPLPLLRSAPMARMRQTGIADTALALRVIDVSIGGCALFLPADVAPMSPGTLLEQVHVDLDADTRFNVNLKLRHVTSLSADARGTRLGCEFVLADPCVLRSLQRFIDQTQKRARLLSAG